MSLRYLFVVLLLLLPAEAQPRKKKQEVFSPTVVGRNLSFEERNHWYSFLSVTHLTDRLRVRIQSQAFAGSMFQGQYFLKPLRKKGGKGEVTPSFYGVVIKQPGQSPLTAFGVELTH